MVTLSYVSYTVFKDGNASTTSVAQAFSSLPLTKLMSTPPTSRNGTGGNDGLAFGGSEDGETSSPLSSSPTLPLPLHPTPAPAALVATAAFRDVFESCCCCGPQFVDAPLRAGAVAPLSNSSSGGGVC